MPPEAALADALAVLFKTTVKPKSDMHAWVLELMRMFVWISINHRYGGLEAENIQLSNLRGPVQESEYETLQ